MKDEIGVSVIIPNYNCLASLPRAIESVRSQNVTVEIIIIDDGSTDGSREWLKSQGDVKVIHTHRLGASGARNMAITHCQYDLIAFLDADDYWLEGKLQHQLTLHVLSPNIMFSFCDYYHVTEAGDLTYSCFQYWPRFKGFMKQKGHHIVEDKIFRHLFAENVVGTSTVVANKLAVMAVGGFDESLKSASDWDLWLKLARCGKVGIVNRPLCHYIFDREGAISRDHEKRLNAIRVILSRHRNAMKQYPRYLIAGYLRWITSIAECNREDRIYWLSLSQEVFVCCLQPSRRHLRAMAGDALRIMMFKKAK